MREKITVGEAVDAYIVWANNEGKQIEPQINRYKKHLRSRLHTIPISAITPGLLSAIKAELTRTQRTMPTPQNPPEGYIPKPAKNLSAQTIHHAFAFLRSAIYRAIATGLWIGSNPLSAKAGGPWQMPRVENKNLRFLTPKEARNLLEAMEKRSLSLRDMAFLSLKTGLRATEIFRLRRQDLDARSNILHVTSKGGRRDAVHIPPDVTAMLKKHADQGEYLFGTSSGGKMQGISASFDRVVADLGLNTKDGDTRYKVTFHTLRHTFASWLAQREKFRSWSCKS